MKKSKIALGLVIVIAAGWSVASWNTGKEIENNIAGSTDRFNDAIRTSLQEAMSGDPTLADIFSSPAAFPRLELVDFNRGVFSSVAHYTVANNSLPSKAVMFEVQIGHGPFPLAALKQFSFAPKAAALDIQLVKTPITSTVFDVTAGKTPFVITSLVGYDHSTESKFVMTPIDYSQFGATVQLKGFEVALDLSGDLKKAKIDAKMDLFGVSQGTAMGMKLEGLTSKSNVVKGDADVFIGKQTAQLKSFKTFGLSMLDVPDITIEQVLVESDSNEVNAKMNDVSTISVANVMVNNLQFGSGKFVAKTSNLDIKSIQALVKAGQDDTYGQNTEAMYPYVESILAASPSFAIAPVSWKNAGGESSATSYIEFQPFSISANKDKMDDALQAFSLLVKKADLDVNISKPMVIDMLTNLMQSYGMSAAEAKTMATAQLDSVIAEAPVFKLAKNDATSITSQINYVDGNVTLNGQKMTLAEFNTQYIQPISASDYDDQGYYETEELSGESAQ